MSLNTWLLRGAVLALAMPAIAPHGGTSSLIGVARADVYHAVEPGETLSSIASQYKTQTDVLRSANKLTNTADNAPLAAMLLRIPDGKPRTTVDPGAASLAAANSASYPSGAAPSTGAPTIVNPFRANESQATAFIGTLSKSLGYTVQAGDTVESIAERHSRAGYRVSAETIRQKNNISNQLVVGQTLIIPIQSLTYRATPERNAQTAAEQSPTLGGAVKVSDEMWLPQAQQVQFIPPKKKVEVRGPSLLSSRSYSPSLDDGVRVLGQGEDAPNVGRTPSPRSRMVNPPSQTSSGREARVARVANGGARIRRLPDAEAVTLYRCAVGTEIAVTKQDGAWSAILMSDRSTGWIPSRYLRFTGESVDISTQVLTMDSGTGKFAYDGNFTSNHPAVAQALTWLGTPYVYGGTGRRGIDCSALVQTSFRSIGYGLPRTAAQQSRVGQPVDPANLQPGDRLYFSASGTRVDHTGLYMGNGMFVHASGRGRGVIVSNLFDRRNWNIFVGARR
jgi:LysM repeat protein